MISVRMKSPGCGGFFMGMVGCSCVSVVIFQIYVADFALGGVNAKRQTAVTGNAQAPCAFAVTGQCVQIYVADFALGGVNAKRQTAVTGNAQAPCAFAVTGQCVQIYVADFALGGVN